MDEKLKMESHSSAAAFVEGGIQDACDDSCSICLEEFSDSDPSTVTGCKHEFHLQCILEWCQRSSQCPMCWQPISMKDPTSQELLEAVEQERDLRVNRARSTTIFRHPMLGDFELQHLPVGSEESELEERIIQHLAAAAAMGRTHRVAGARGRASPHFLVFSSPHAAGPVLSDSPGEGLVDGAGAGAGAGEEPPLSAPQGLGGNGSNGVHNNNSNAAGQTSPVSNDTAGPSDLHSFSESLKSRLQSVSMRYKDSITKSTRGWRDRFFSRNSVADISSDVRNEVSAGIAAVSRMMERLETRDGTGTGTGAGSAQPTDTRAGSTEIGGTGSAQPTDTRTGSTVIGGTGSGQHADAHTDLMEIGGRRETESTSQAGRGGIVGTDGAGTSRSVAELK